MSSAKVSTREVDVDLYWRAVKATAVNYTVFVQLLDSHGKLVSQSDSYPWNGGYPTSDWQPGSIVRDTYHLPLPDSSPSGTYLLIAGAYRLETMQRLAVHDANGQPIGDFAPLTRLNVRGA
jgi:hypothetical protein